MSEEPGRNDAGIVQDEQVSGAQKPRKITELRVSLLPGVAVQVQHSRRSPVLEGLLGDEIFWKMEVEIRDEHEMIIG